MGLLKWLKNSWNVDSRIDHIEEQALMRWPQASVIFMGMWFSMFAVTVGFTIGTMIAPIPAIIACIVGFACTGLYLSLVGTVGCRERKPTILILESFAGKPVAILFAISIVIIYTWAMGMQADIAGIAIASAVGAKSPSFYSAGVATIMICTGIIGINAIKKLASFAVPFLICTVFTAAYLSLSGTGPLSETLATPVAAKIGLGGAISLSAGAWISLATMAPDITRYIDRPRDVVTAATLSMILGVALPIIGVLLAVTTRVSDIGLTFQAVGFTWVGVASVFFAAWATNDNNAYCGGIALSRLTGWNRRVATSVIAIGGIILAYFGAGATSVIGASLGWLISAAGPVGAIIIAHYFILQRNGRETVAVPSWVGIVTFVVGVIFAHLGAGGAWALTAFPGFALSIFGSAVFYLTCAAVLGTKGAAAPEASPAQ